MTESVCVTVGDSEIVREFGKKPGKTEIVATNDIPPEKASINAPGELKCQRCMVEFPSLEEMSDMSNHDETLCAEQGCNSIDI